MNLWFRQSLMYIVWLCLTWHLLGHIVSSGASSIKLAVGHSLSSFPYVLSTWANLGFLTAWWQALSEWSGQASPKDLALEATYHPFCLKLLVEANRSPCPNPREENTDLTSQWEEPQYHIVRWASGMGDIVACRKIQSVTICLLATTIQIPHMQNFLMPSLWAPKSQPIKASALSPGSLCLN